MQIINNFNLKKKRVFHPCISLLLITYFYLKITNSIAEGTHVLLEFHNVIIDTSWTRPFLFLEENISSFCRLKPLSNSSTQTFLFFFTIFIFGGRRHCDHRCGKLTPSLSTFPRYRRSLRWPLDQPRSTMITTKIDRTSARKGRKLKKR